MAQLAVLAQVVGGAVGHVAHAALLQQVLGAFPCHLSGRVLRRFLSQRWMIRRSVTRLRLLLLLRGATIILESAERVTLMCHLLLLRHRSSSSVWTCAFLPHDSRS